MRPGRKMSKSTLIPVATDEVSIRSRLRLLSYPCFICVSSVAYLNYFLATDETRMKRVQLVAAERSKAALGHTGYVHHPANPDNARYPMFRDRVSH